MLGGVAMNAAAHIRLCAAKDKSRRDQAIAAREHPQQCPECSTPVATPREVELASSSALDLCCGGCGYIWRAPLRGDDTLRDQALQHALDEIRHPQHRTRSFR